jgi:hypothetical protein
MRTLAVRLPSSEEWSSELDTVRRLDGQEIGTFQVDAPQLT